MAKKEKAEPQAPSLFKTIVQSLSFHKFDEEPELTALYKETVHLGDEEDPDKLYRAHVMIDLNTGEEKYVQNSYAINKAITTAQKIANAEGLSITEMVFQIKFLGKTEVKGKPFNQFKIGYCTMAEYETSNQQ